jgi:7,8-dihydropterin-6-yl-methyl-4-(beta-D-ribofuranosyl)aminobenzene 5'-phosphate synthase
MATTITPAGSRRSSSMPGLSISSAIPRATGFESTAGPFFLDPDGKTADRIEDDLALWVGTDEGLVVCAGCSHSGIVNTLDHVRGLAGVQRIQAVIGGFHLTEAGDERLEQTIAGLRRLNPAVIVPCHCTGDQAAAALKDEFGERVLPGAAGMTFRFGSR